MQSAQGFPFWKPLFMGWYIATPSRRLPVSTCHRQLDTDTGVEQIVPPLLVVRRILRRTCCNQVQKKGCCVSQQPFVEIFCQPLTAPIVTPSRKYFCSVKNRMNIGSAESVAPAIMGAKSVSFANLKVLRPTWIVNI